jgi:hypothetical protein
VTWAYALRGAFGDEGEQVWHGFAEQSDKNHGPTTKAVWRDATLAEAKGQLRSGAGTVLRIAGDEGWTPPPLSDADQRMVDETFANLGVGKAAEEGPAPHYPAAEEDPETATARLRETLASFLAEAAAWVPDKGPPPQMGVRAAAGLGKSTALLEALAAWPGPQPEVWYFVPRIEAGAGSWSPRPAPWGCGRSWCAGARPWSTGSPCASSTRRPKSSPASGCPSARRCA